MQPAPKRLQHAIWSAFKAAGPASSSGARVRPDRGVRFDRPLRAAAFRVVEQRWPSQVSHSRFYGDPKRPDLDKKIEDARSRIDKTIESKANPVINLSKPEQDTVKSSHDETIIHTHPEASSIVYDHGSSGENAANAATEANQGHHHTTTRGSTSNFENVSTHTQRPISQSSNTPLPSQLAARYSRLRERFIDFMDNFQTHVFTASKRLNDLTGYSSIERLKKDIEQQETFVREARQLVKDSRSAYQQAVTTRSDTQREVNDLLHRKHAWSSQDLERFTNLYRSDHANEQAEQKAHTQLSQAEAAYEEASAKLSKGILARYHEEQVWSDKIRQMSTWGTWGLMGLNVLLFVVFQILVEPWRRRRLVRGFEEKVQEALKEQSAEQELRTLFHVAKAQEGIAAQPTSGTDEMVAITAEPQVTSQAMEEMAQRTALEKATDTGTFAAENTLQSTSPSSLTETAKLETPPHANSSTQLFDKDTRSDRLKPLSKARYKDMPFLLGSHTRRYFESIFDENSKVSISQRDLTAKVLEGAFMGAVGVVCFFWIAGVSSHSVR